jgi:glycosyltransferase involved in cell wall biosynthesis
MPKLSVVIPNFNHARFLPKRIESILCQTYKDFELILLDDCSTDDSRSILSQYASDPRVRIEFNTVNSGTPFKQWNKGVRLSRGEYIWIAESDDYADERFLERLVPLLDTDPQIVFAFCRSWRVDDENRPCGYAEFYDRELDAKRWQSDFLVEGPEECRNYFIFGTPAPNASAVVFRKSVYEKARGADESFRVCGDWKLWAAMAFTGRIAYLAEPLNYFRFHSSSVRHDTAREGFYALETLRTVRWVLGQVKATESGLEKMRQRHAACWVPAIMSMHVPLSMKRAILREAKAIDPHPMRRVAGPALETVQRKFTRHWRSFRAIFSPTV